MNIEIAGQDAESIPFPTRYTGPQTYHRFAVKNSKRSTHERARIQTHRIINLQDERDFDAQPLVSITTVRAFRDEGKALRFEPSPRLLRAFRSRYEPHVGAKQKRKAFLRRGPAIAA